jgi:hypothetical protein
MRQLSTASAALMPPFIFDRRIAATGPDGTLPNAIYCP